jgi:hypothetical protein
MEVNSPVGVYECIGTPLWKKAVARLSGAGHLFVTGFQTVSGLASDFAARLQYVSTSLRASKAGGCTRA